MTPVEIERLAHLTASLRPEWPYKSLHTLLQNFTHSQPHRAYIDTAHALVEIALDPKTKNPGRLAENGPWWEARPGGEKPRPVVTGAEIRSCAKCGARYSEPDSEHTCATRAARDSQAKAEAMRVATEVAGGYARGAGARDAEAQ